MSNITLINPVVPDAEALEHSSILVIRRLAELLGMVGVSDAQVWGALGNPAVAFADPCLAVVRHIAWRVCSIPNSNATVFRLDADTLYKEAVSLCGQREGSFYCDKVWREECRYLVPQVITEADDWPSLLAPLINWKEFGFRFRHASELQVGLLLLILSRLSIAIQAARYELYKLLDVMIFVPPWQLCERLYLTMQQINDMGDKE